MDADAHVPDGGLHRGADLPHGEAPGEWILVTRATVDVMGLAEDTCLVELLRAPGAELLRLRHADFPQLDGEIELPRHRGTDQQAATTALEVAAYRGLLVASEDFTDGLVTAQQCGAAVAKGQEARRKEREANIDESLERERRAPSQIVQAALDLGLGPQPAGHAVGAWVAQCPRRGHSLMVSPRSEQFGCGYCRVKGGPDELRALVRRRQASQ